MKNRKHKFAFALSLFVLIGTTGLGAALMQTTPNAVEEAVAAPTTYTIPTTIDLNDYTETQIRNYYSSLNSLASTEKQGTNLLKNLKPILYNMRYTSYENVWKTSAITERNWTRSPASSLASGAGTYNASTNKITGYKYSNNGTYDDPYLVVIYRNDNDTHQMKASSSHGDTYNALNREHLWPQSRGFKAGSGAAGPAGTDIHHLILADARVNQLHHNNWAYGDVINVSVNENQDGIGGNKRGTGSLGSTQVFEPIDEHKGDIARACFYMAARYNNWAGASGVISEFEPFLILDDNIDTGGSAIGSTDTTPASYGALSTLLEWNRLDPVSEHEIHRNNLIHRNYQQNRNPFIDFPEWAEYIWGNKQNEWADPANDEISNVGQEASAPTAINVLPSTLSLNVGGSQTLSVQTTPSNASKSVTWTSSKTSVATVDSNGTVSAISVGSATITAKSTLDQSIIGTATVNVITAPSLTSITISGHDTTVKLMDIYDTSNIVVTANYSNGTSANVASSSIIETPDSSRLGTQTLAVSYSENGITKNTSFDVFVTNSGVQIGDVARFATDLFISEYIEGSSNNKYLEIYNGTGQSVDLSGYKLQLFANGASEPNNDIALSGNLAHNSTIVYKNTSAALTLPSGVTATINAALNYNGDDAVALYKISTSAYVDIFGTIGIRPDKGAWTGGGVTTVDKTLVRKPSVYQGITANPTEFDPSVEWIQYGKDDVSHLGSHTMTATVPGITKEIQANAWAEYFLEITGEYCEDLNGGLLVGTTWNTLGSEYGYMDSTTKALFASTTSDSSVGGIAGAKARYHYLITKYTALAANNYMRDGSNNVIFNANQRQMEMNNYEIVPILMIILSAILISAGLFRLLKKKNQH